MLQEKNNEKFTKHKQLIKLTQEQRKNFMETINQNQIKRSRFSQNREQQINDYINFKKELRELKINDWYLNMQYEKETRDQAKYSILSKHFDKNRSASSLTRVNAPNISTLSNY